MQDRLNATKTIGFQGVSEQTEFPISLELVVEDSLLNYHVLASVCEPDIHPSNVETNTT